MGVNESRTSVKKYHMHKIDENIFIGDQYSVQNESELKSHGIKHILQLFDVPANEKMYNLCIRPLPRGKTFSVIPYLQDCLRFINEAESKGEKVLVHCKWGKNRSAIVLIAYYMAKKGWTYEHAVEFIKKKRAIDPSLRLKNQLISAGKELSSYLTLCEEITNVA
ncbi:unnamed protein product [Blepharisma stoltei]|uniref:protein-tyrosine-phosphatase n=1 Tax=Blepharisma stoltei TaxID=1481888 RepID=A0AAU9JXK4_9CILI|nr:unnamed protein product [Blepharisma stoltei]